MSTDAGNGNAAIPRTEAGYSVLSLSSVYNQSGRWGLNKYNHAISGGGATPVADHLDFVFFELLEARDLLRAPGMLYDEEAPDYVDDDDCAGIVHKLEQLIAAGTPGGVVRCAPQIIHDRYMEPIVSNIYALYTFEKDQPTDSTFDDFNLVDSIYAFRCDDDPTANPKPWHCITPCASTLRSDDEKKVTISTVKNMFMSGKLTYFTYVTLRYYRLVAKGDDAAVLPTMTEYWDMTEVERKKDKDLANTLKNVYTDSHASMNCMQETKQVKKMFDKIETAVVAKRELEITEEDYERELATEKFKKARGDVQKEVKSVEQLMYPDKQFPHPLMKISFNGTTQAFRSSQQVDKLKLTIGIDDAMQQQTDLYITELMNHVNSMLAKEQRDQMDIENADLKESVRKMTDEIAEMTDKIESLQKEAALASDAATEAQKTADDSYASFNAASQAATQILDEEEGDGDEDDCPKAAALVQNVEETHAAQMEAAAEAKKKKKVAEEAKRALKVTTDQKRALRSRLVAIQKKAHEPTEEE